MRDVLSGLVKPPECLGYVLIMLTLGSSGCVHRNVAVERIEPVSGYMVRTPIKAHLRDGHTILFRDGARITGRSVLGGGERYDLTLKFVGRLDSIPLDSIVGLESFRTQNRVGATIVTTTLAVAGTATAVGLAAVAIFGSCPTVYSDSAGSPYLESEAFSYSIAPIFEGRDVDRLRARPDEAGRLRLDVRNEALETHYLNRLSLLEVSHDRDALVAPDPGGTPLVFSEPLALKRAVDGVGRDLRAILARRDGNAFRSDSLAVREILGRNDPTIEQLQETIELELPVDPGSPELGLVLTLRNSLFSTVLFYDLMLGSQGARALDWLGSDLSDIDRATKLGLWVVRNLGLRLEVWDGAWRSAGRIADTGPIAWKEIGFTLPVVRGQKSLRVRITFPLDSWRIDRVRAFGRVDPGIAVPVQPARLLDASDADLGSAVASLVDVDDRYLVTTPGQRFFIEFEPDPDDDQLARTYLLVSHGYYTEWVRPDWVVRSPEATSFQPAEGTLLEALRRWWSVRQDMETRFFESRIPVASSREAIQ